MLVRIKCTRNGLNTTKDLKTLNALIWWNDVKNPKRFTRSENGVENPKGLLLRNGQKPVRGVPRCETVSKTQKASRCETFRMFECKTPFEFDIAFALFIPLRVCVWPFGVYIPLPFWPLWPPISLLTCTCTPLWVFSVRARASPYGIFGRSEDEWSLMGLLAVSKTSEVL